jgi:hypothetical protein
MPIKKGNIPWNKGKHLSQKHRENISQAKKGKSHKGVPWTKEQWKKQVEVHIGKHQSEETRRKQSEALKGEKAPNYKGGISPENERIRQSLEYRLWRKAVFARDNFTCQKCGQRGGILRAHHINNFADFPELRFAINNGITLCQECHTKFHRIYSEYNNTKEQLEEFLNFK